MLYNIKCIFLPFLFGGIKKKQYLCTRFRNEDNKTIFITHKKV